MPPYISSIRSVNRIFRLIYLYLQSPSSLVFAFFPIQSHCMGCVHFSLATSQHRTVRKMFLELEIRNSTCALKRSKWFGEFCVVWDAYTLSPIKRKINLRPSLMCARKIAFLYDEKHKACHRYSVRYHRCYFKELVLLFFFLHIYYALQLS